MRATFNRETSEKLQWNKTEFDRNKQNCRKKLKGKQEQNYEMTWEKEQDWVKPWQNLLKKQENNWQRNEYRSLKKQHSVEIW